MNDKELYLKIESIIKEVIKSQKINSEIDNDTRLLYIVNNSTLAVNLIISIEEDFDIEIEDEDIDANFFLSMENIIEIIKKYL